MLNLIYGGNGWIGGQFCEYFARIGINWSVSNTRVNNYDDIINELFEKKPTHVISFIGRTHGCIGDKKYTTIDYFLLKLEQN